MELVIRPSSEADQAFLFKVFAGSRKEFAQIGWDSGQLELLLRQQFDFQRRGYATTNRYAVTEIFVVDGTDCGYQTVDRSGEEIVLVDVAILPEHQGRGIGTKAVQQLIALAGETMRAVVLRVALDGSAHRLYERLGFSGVGEYGMYQSMRWSAHSRMGVAA